MWWRWILLVLSGIAILACVISTIYDWIKGKTGPFGPNPLDFWGCGVFTLILAACMYWLTKSIF